MRSWTACLGLVVPAILLAAWAVLSGIGWLPAQILPDPSLVAKTIAEFAASGELLEHVTISLQRVLIGFAIGSAAGLLIGTAIGLSANLRAFFLTPFLFLTQVHVLALLPLLVLLVGIDEEMKIIVITWAAFVPMVLNTAQGIRNVPVQWREVGAVLTFDPWYQFSRIIAPASAPAIFTGLREAVANSWQALVIAELFASSEGLGYLVGWGRQLFQLDILLMSILAIGVIGLALNAAIGHLERRMYRWSGGTV